MTKLIVFIFSLILSNSLFASDFTKSIERLTKGSKANLATFSMRGGHYEVDIRAERPKRTEESKQKAVFIMVVAALFCLMLFLIGDRLQRKQVLVANYPNFDFEDRIFYRALQSYLDDPKQKEIVKMKTESEEKIKGKLKYKDKPERRL